MELRSISVGEGKQDFMHTISGGEETNPPLVCLPGYGAGAAFYFRNFDGLAQQFRLHLVDLLGTGMSGRSFDPKQGEGSAACHLSTILVHLGW
jgi:pimeloyl-ACP methyl ester carboxylesterase